MSLILLFPLAVSAASQIGTPRTGDDALVKRALANEVRAATDGRHPMRYRLRKASPRVSSTKEICETRDGAVARLIAINDAPLSQADEQREQQRLDQLLSDPGKQRHRKQAETEDAARAMKVLQVLPEAFLYQDAGPADATGKTEKFTFRPNPKFNPPDLETQVLTGMTGEMWIDIAQERVTRLEGRLEEDVDFGWGILGQLKRGGSIVIEQADVGDHQWRIVHFKMSMNARVVFKTRSFDTTEDQTGFAPVPVDLRYQQAIGMLRGEGAHAGNGEEATASKR
jgi:hypothetical protein